ncbi:folate-binding protein YgfZ [Elioraea sp.]|uniref:CAF17-like 4Fe-4S cluster assembly/insertion protein YgfZ n=1 Tax=Elioraea sp. TaxID=2185103 RepID=UPI0021DCEDAE|nr:folate-binding protein [Elioraea sp.]GIX09108.1 MAG: glycine cleavage system protein T [Elioraea sp.]
MPIAVLPDRAVIAVAGPDATPFLQGLVSNDVTLAAQGPVWAALLTPQGKWLADFFVLRDGDRLLLDGERGQAAFLVQHLARYRLRAKVAIAEEAGLDVVATWDAAPPAGLGGRDPRLAEAGWRVLCPAGSVAADADAAAYDRHRLRLGLPDGSRDLESGRTVLLEAGFDELHGVSWTKGCYMGQELTARTRYRGLVKRRLVPVAVDGVLPEPGTPVLLDDAEVGTIRSGRGERAMALLRIEAIRAGRPLACGAAVLHPDPPPWMVLPQADAA